MKADEGSITFSCRTRITLILTALLLLILVSLQYLSVRAQREVQRELDRQKELVKDTVDKQSNDISEAMALAVGSYNSDMYLYDTIETEPVTFDRDRIRHIIIVKEEDGLIDDA